MGNQQTLNKQSKIDNTKINDLLKHVEELKTKNFETESKCSPEQCKISSMKKISSTIYYSGNYDSTNCSIGYHSLMLSHE